jgi:hypothetical protein
MFVKKTKQRGKFCENAGIFPSDFLGGWGV